MGHRAYLIEENEDGTFTRTYSHWGAARITDLPKKMFYSDEDIELEDLDNTFQELKEKELQKNNSSQKTSKKVEDLIDPSDICIEAVAIKTLSNDFIVGLNTLTDYSHMIFVHVDDIIDINHLENKKNHISNYVRTAEKQGLDEKTIKEGIRTELNRRFTRDYIDVVLTGVEHEKTVLDERPLKT